MTSVVRVLAVSLAVFITSQLPEHAQAQTDEETTEAPSTTEPPEPCAGAEDIVARIERLLAAGEAAFAETYLEIQDTNSGLDSCIDELRSTVENQRRDAAQLVAEARSAREAGAEPAAFELLLAALDLDDSAKGARSELDSILDPTEPTSFDAALALKEAGYDDAAAEEVIKQVTENGVSEPIPDDLVQEEAKDWFDRSLDWLGPVLAPLQPDNLPWTVATASVLLAAAIVTLRLLTRSLTPEHRDDPWDPGDNKLARWVAGRQAIRRAVRPVVRFDFDQDGSDVKALASLRDAVTSALVRDSSGETLQRVGTGDLAAELEAIDVGIPSVNTGTKILSRLFVQRTITVAMTLEPVHDRRVGATVIVTDWRGRTFDAKRFHGEQRDLGKDDKPDYMEISPKVTAWLGFLLADIWRAGAGPPSVAGTEVPDSYSCFLAGFQARGRREDKLARELYARALEHDSTNQHAMLGIGLIDGYDPTRLDNAVLMLARSRCVRGLTTMPTHEHPEFVRWTQASYAEAVCRLQRSSTKLGSADDLDKAHELGRGLVCKLSRGARHADTRDLKTFCRKSLPLARSLLNSIRLERSTVWPDPPSSPGTSDEDWTDYMVSRIESESIPPRTWENSLDDAATSLSARYNTACTYARAARCELEHDPNRTELIEGLESMALLHVTHVVSNIHSLGKQIADDRVFGELKKRRAAEFDKAVGKTVEPDGWNVRRLEPTAP